MSGEPILAVHGLSAWYGAAQILYELDLEVARGEVVALMGRNGAGKSTTLKSIMGLVARRHGSASGVHAAEPFMLVRQVVRQDASIGVAL